jgi:hypothetical protein
MARARPGRHVEKEGVVPRKRVRKRVLDGESSDPLWSAAVRSNGYGRAPNDNDRIPRVWFARLAQSRISSSYGSSIRPMPIACRQLATCRVANLGRAGLWRYRTPRTMPSAPVPSLRQAGVGRIEFCVTPACRRETEELGDDEEVPLRPRVVSNMLASRRDPSAAHHVNDPGGSYAPLTARPRCAFGAVESSGHKACLRCCR